MRRVDWLDDAGRWHASGLPHGVPDSEAAIGVPLGPPDLAPLELPLAVEVRLHNALFRRELLTAGDIRNNLQAVQSALSAALRVDVHTIAALYDARVEVDAPT